MKGSLVGNFDFIPNFYIPWNGFQLIITIRVNIGVVLTGFVEIRLGSPG